MCNAELCACGNDCVAIEGCLEAVCWALDGLSDEGQCQVYCQDLHLPAKQQHLDVALCAFYDSQCAPSCAGYPADYQACRTTMQAGACATAWTACSNSADCQVYIGCSTICTTLTACLGCSDDPQSMAGRQLYEAYETCIARECIALSWW